MMQPGGWDFIVRLLNITLIDIALSGDNAIVIGMAAASLPRPQRRWAILIGGGLAVVFRIALTSAATLLMLLPFISAAGGLILLWVVYKLLRVDTQPPHESGGKKGANDLAHAVLLIVAADFLMSLDNVIAVAGSAHGSLALLIVGLLISMPLLMVTGGFISNLIDRARWLVYVGAFAISFTAARMFFEDRAVEERLRVAPWLVIAASVAAGLIVPALCILTNRLLARQKLPPNTDSPR